ncbi:MAG: diaminopimelate epimerase [Planctomycetes bacterium]|nr:diaminopimelate epimerase [Planctomycetota bacterium]
MVRMRFAKMHGAGNDYVVVDATKRRPAGNLSALARAVSDRHTGIGSDGLILIAKSRRADFRMIMFNADGSEGEMCGNGLRCIAKYAADHGLTRKKRLRIETPGGIVAIERNARIIVAMGAPRPIPPSFHVAADGTSALMAVNVAAGGRRYPATVVSMGNPHCVIEVDDAGTFPVQTIGPLIERHPDFPSRVNVEFAQVMAPDRVKQRTWERGSGETLACGSGACAVAVALRAAGHIRERASIELRGGTLALRVAPDGQVFMTGPAVEVFSGEWPTR